MKAEYNFSNGVRGKYAKKAKNKKNTIILAPDVSLFFSNSKDVNEALRSLVKLANRSIQKKSPKKLTQKNIKSRRA